MGDLGLISQQSSFFRFRSECEIERAAPKLRYFRAAAAAAAAADLANLVTDGRTGSDLPRRILNAPLHAVGGG